MSTVRRSRTLAGPHFVPVPSEQFVWSSSMSRSKLQPCGRSSSKGKWAQKPVSQKDPPSSSEKVPQNPRENHLPVLLLALLVASLCLPFSLLSMLVSRPLRKDKYIIAMSIALCFSLVASVQKGLQRKPLSPSEITFAMLHCSKACIQPVAVCSRKLDRSWHFPFTFRISLCGLKDIHENWHRLFLHPLPHSKAVLQPRGLTRGIRWWKEQKGQTQPAHSASLLSRVFKMGPSTPAHATENVGKRNKSIDSRSYGNPVDINCKYRSEMFDGKMNPHNASLA